MGEEVYLFALFVFVLLVLLVFMLVRGLRKGDSKEKLAKMEREDRMLEMYAQMDDMVEATEEYVEETKAEMEAALRRMEELCARMELRLEELDRQPRVFVPPVIEVEEEEPEAEEEEEQRPSRVELLGRVSEMYAGGESAEDIARELGIARGEIAFMLKLSEQKKPQAKKKTASGAGGQKKSPGRPKKPRDGEETAPQTAKKRSSSKTAQTSAKSEE